MIFTSPPEQFAPRFEVVSCFVEHEGRVLFLRRHPTKSEGDKWGVPAGKVDTGETLVDAMCRELQEETGLRIQTSAIEYVLPVFVRYPDYDYTFHIFRTRMSTPCEICISPAEHTASQWITIPEALNLGEQLVMDEDACIKLVYGISEKGDLLVLRLRNASS